MTTRVLSLGAGVQSTTIYLLAMEGRVQIDAAVFADTGEEPSPVYAHLEWLKSLGGPKIVTGGVPTRLGDSLRLGLNSRGGRSVSIPAYTKAVGGKTEGHLRRQCTKEYKTDVVGRTIRRVILGLAPGRGAKPNSVVQLIGMSLEEGRRQRAVWDRFAKKRWTRVEFPLVDLQMTRNACIAYLRTRVPHEVPRSACTFCPYRSNSEWRWLQEHDPAGWNRAVEIDAALRVEGNVCNRGLNQPMFIHRTCKPLTEVDFSEPETLNLFSAVECQGMCGV